MNEAKPTGIGELARVYVDIALCRRGPQHLPASPFLLAATIAAYFILNVILGALLPQMKGSHAFYTALDCALTLAWYRGVLLLAGRQPRFTQTVTAAFGYQCVLTPLFAPVNWLALRFGSLPAWQLPVALLSLGLVVWTLMINARILRHSTEWPVPACVGLVLLQLILQQLLLLQFFPQT